MPANNPRPAGRKGRWFLLAIVVVAVAIYAAITHRHQLLIKNLGTGAPPPLLEAQDEGPDARWLDDYFVIVTIDPQTFAIVEPRYEQQNINYLIVGHDRALLFDAGSGLRDVAAAAATLTEKPITFVPSHLHYDHIGNGRPYARLALVDLPHLRERAITGESNESLTLTWEEHLGSAEGYALPTLKVDEWLAPNSVVSLGGRALRVLYTPGHTDDSISLYDTARGYLFAGDFMYQGPLYAFLPNSSLGDYSQGAATLLGTVPDDVKIFGAHRTGPQGVPILNRSDIQDISDTLQKISNEAIEPEGSYPLTYPINERMQLLAEPPWLQNWKQRYPDL